MAEYYKKDLNSHWMVESVQTNKPEVLSNKRQQQEHDLDDDVSDRGEGAAGQGRAGPLISSLFKAQGMNSDVTINNIHVKLLHREEILV